jgi:hypothetical protein
MGDGDTLRSLPRTCGRQKSGQVSTLFNKLTYNKFNAVNVLMFKKVYNNSWRPWYHEESHRLRITGLLDRNKNYISLRLLVWCEDRINTHSIQNKHKRVNIVSRFIRRRLFIDCLVYIMSNGTMFMNVFLVYLTTLFQQLRLYSVEGKDDRWMMNCKG